MDELTIDGKIYLSSKKAAALTGYAKDYVGQLCREGRVEAKLVGRSWYVYEPSIRKHRFEGEETMQEQDAQTSDVESSEKTNVEAVFEPATYHAEEVVSMPLVEETVEPEPNEEIPSSPVSEAHVEEIENAWQEWFQKDTAPVEEVSVEEEKIEEVEASVPEETHEVPIMRREEPIPHQPAYTEQAAPQPVYREERPMKAEMRRKKVHASSHVVLKAVLIAIMLLSLAITTIGVGEAGTVTGTASARMGIIQFFEGATTVNSLE
jgi:hypothetical protein